MPTAFFEDFETDGNGTRYETSIDEFLSGGRRGSSDFFARVDDTTETGTSISGSYGNTDGSWFAVADFDGRGNATQSETMTFTGIDISGLTDLNFSGSFASVKPQLKIIAAQNRIRVTIDVVPKGNSRSSRGSDRGDIITHPWHARLLPGNWGKSQATSGGHW